MARLCGLPGRLRPMASSSAEPFDARPRGAEPPSAPITFLAAAMAFYAFLAFVPLLTAVVLIFALAVNPAALAGDVQAIAQHLPPSAAQLVAGALRNIVAANDGQKMLGTIVALLFALWGALQGAQAVLTAAAIMRGTADRRGFFRGKLAALGITLRMVFGALAALAAIASAGYLQQLFGLSSPTGRFVVGLTVWLVVGAIIARIFAATYRAAGIETGHPKSGWATGNAVEATLLWIAATFVFSLYVANFANYNVTYGALAGVIVFVLWLYISAYVFLWGARRELRRLPELAHEHPA